MATESEFVTHPLFPLNDDEDDPDAVPPDVQEIHVQRKENGRLYTAPRVFFPNELTSLAQLFAEFGGGEYHLVARNAKKQLQARRMFTLQGPSKPMFDDGAIPGQAPKAPAQPTNPMMAMMGASGGESGGFMGLIMMMMQNMMSQQAQASQQSMQMMMAFISTLSQGTQADKQAAQEAMNRQAERDARTAENQMQMMIKLTEARQAGNSTGGEESFFKGVEFMKHFATQQVEMLKATATKSDGGGLDLESLAGSLIEAFQGFKAFQQMSEPGNIPVAAPSEVVS